MVSDTIFFRCLTLVFDKRLTHNRSVMPNDSLMLFLVWAFVAEVIGTMAGFGAATVLTPIASFFFDIKTAVAVVACFHLFGNASRLAFFGRAVDWKIVGQFGLIGIAWSFLGAHLAAGLPAFAIRLALGVFLVVYVIVEWTRVVSLRIPATTTSLIIGGGVSGLIAGLIGTGGAIRSVCLLTFGLPRETYIATSAAIALAVDATRLPVYLTQHFIPGSLLWVIVGLTAVAFAGAWAGQRLVRQISPGWFKHIVLVMLFLMGVKLLVDSLREVW